MADCKKYQVRHLSDSEHLAGRHLSVNTCDSVYLRNSLIESGSEQ